MKASIAFLHGPHDLRVREVELPPLRADQVLIRTGACGICGSDVECFEGRSKEGRYDLGPYTPGHEWAGEVAEVGSGVRTLAAGNKVTGDCVMACGVCRNCKEGQMPSACLSMREAGFRPDSPGGMGEYLVVEERYLHRIPDSWSFEEGAWVETFSIGYFSLWGNGGFIDASDTALVLGAGPVGISALMVAKTAGARTIAVDPLPGRRQFALRYGADNALDPGAGPLREQVMELTDGQGCSVVVEASGNDAAIASVFELAGHGARVRLIGHSVGHKVPVEIGLTLWRTLRISGAGGTRDFGERTIRFMERIRDRWNFRALNTHRFAFGRLAEAFEVACRLKAEALKVMLVFC